MTILNAKQPFGTIYQIMVPLLLLLKEATEISGISNMVPLSAMESTKFFQNIGGHCKAAVAMLSLLK